MDIMDKQFNYKGYWFRIIIKFSKSAAGTYIDWHGVQKKHSHEVTIVSWHDGFKKSVEVDVALECGLIDVVNSLTQEAEAWVDGIEDKELALTDIQAELKELGFVAKYK